jgi:DNA repair protein RadD
MSFTPRPYQQAAIDAHISFFKTKKQFNGVSVLPTGSGKSVVIAHTAMNLEGNTLIFQPSKEILQQNYAKFISYGYRAGIYSASAGHKFIERTTFATIGSVIKKKHLFREFKNIIIDECHLVAADSGMYLEFINSIEDARVLGLTATPYRLSNGFDGAMLKFITRTRPKVFNKIIYYIQNDLLFNEGFLAPLKYFSFNVINRDQIEMNSAGTDFTDSSLKAYYRQINMPKITADYSNKILSQRNNLLVFCALVDEAREVVSMVPGSILITGETEAKERDRILAGFKAGRIRCVVNVGVLTTGFDYPALEAALMARSTMSLALYYQIIGRVMRPFTYPDGTKKVGWFCDLGGNVDFFGKIETMQIVEEKPGLHSIMNNGRHLTNVTFTKK